MLFRLENVAKEFGVTRLFSGVTVQANPGDRIGLIGRNGSGKTTLLDLIQGRLEPDSGRVLLVSGLEFSRIRQIPEFDAAETLLEHALHVFDGFRQWEERLRRLEAEMAEGEGISESAAAEYERLRTRLRLEGGYDYRARTEGVLLGLGFRPADLELPCGHASGGQISRLALARALLRPAGMLLLDEPTNHLDLEGILWLEKHLAEQPRPFVLISHDRHFLDRVSRLTWEIEGGTLHAYPGHFSASRRLKRERLDQAWKEYRRQQEWKEKTEEFVRRNLYGQKTKQAQARRRQLEKTEWLPRPPDPSGAPTVRIPEAGRGGALSFQLTGVTVGFPGKPLIRDVRLTVRRGERLAILGGNGSGKSTLLRSLMREHPLLAGSLEWGAHLVPAYFSQNPDLGEDGRSVYDCLRELDLSATDEQLRSYAARFQFREEEIHKKVGALSGGERSRLALARLLYHPCNVLLMDEPTNHLDIDSREALERALEEFGGTLVVVSHDLYFVGEVVDRFLLIRRGRLEPLEELSGLEALLLERPEAEERKTASAPAAEPPAQTGLSKNERRRRELKLAGVEKEIASLESRKREVLEALQGGSEYEQLQRLGEEAEQLEKRLAELYRQWEGLAAELA